MERTTHFWHFNLFIYPHKVTAYSETSNPEYSRYSDTRWCARQARFFTATYTNEPLGSLYFGYVFMWGEPMAADKMLSFQDNVWSKCYECNCAIGELSSRVPPCFMNSIWVRWHQWVFDDLWTLNMGLTHSFRTLSKASLVALPTCWFSSFDSKRELRN